MRNLTLLLLAAGLPAQTTWIVGYGGSFLNIQHAIDSPLVQPGDTLQLVPGPLPFECFDLHKALTILGPATIAGDPLYSGSYWMNVRPGAGHARLVDLSFTDPLYAFWFEVRDGRTTFDNCTFGMTVNLRTGATADFQHCLLLGPPPPGNTALRIEPNAHASAVDSVVDCHSFGIVNWGYFQGQSLQVTTVNYPPLEPNGHTWVADSVFTAGGTTVVTTYPDTSLARCTQNFLWSGGNQNADLVGCRATSAAPRLGQPYDFEVHAAPATPVLIDLSLELGWSAAGGFVEPSWTAGQAVFPLLVLATDANGVATMPLTIPNLPWLRGLGIWVHARTVSGGQWRTSPPAGGVIR